MKLTITEYYTFFGGTISCGAIAKKCRDGELDAVKDETGKWIIDVQIPSEVYEAKQKAQEKREYANRLHQEYRKTEKEIQELMSVVMDFYGLSPN